MREGKNKSTCNIRILCPFLKPIKYFTIVISAISGHAYLWTSLVSVVAPHIRVAVGQPGVWPEAGRPDCLA